MRQTFIVVLFLASIPGRSQSPNISTVDIRHFWEAYDSLATAPDSIGTFQRLYIDRATRGLKEFIKLRNFEAGEYVTLIKHYPLFWKSIRKNTERIASQHQKITAIFDEFKKLYPDFQSPAVYFTIGCMRTGGTVRDDLILVGSEFVSIDSTVNTTEIPDWLTYLLTNSGDAVSMVVHEAVHTQQKDTRGHRRDYQRHPLLTQSIREGCADFISFLLIGTILNKTRYEYGIAHETELWKEFTQQMNSKDFSRWLYNARKSPDRPPDLGYFIGYRICERYYNNADNKAKAIRDLLRINNYPKLLKASGYDGY